LIQTGIKLVYDLSHVYTRVPVSHICMRMHIIEQGGVANDDVMVACWGGKEVCFGEM